MEIKNTSAGTLTIAGVYSIPAGGSRSFAEDLWAALRERPAVKQWMAEGKLVEITATEAAALSGDAVESDVAAEVSADPQPATEAAARDPLDHDGDGRKGGSKPRGKK